VAILLLIELPWGRRSFNGDHDIDALFSLYFDICKLGHVPLLVKGIRPISCIEKGAIMSKDRKPARGVNPCNATAMRKASRRLTLLYDDALEPCGLRSTQFAILAELNRRSLEPPTMRELADTLVMDRSALGHNLRPLERDALIALEECEADRRRRHVVMTPQGKAKFKEAKRLWQTAQDRFNEVFGQSPATDLRATLLAIAYDERLATLRD
jgi:DNA-binding MarR family transcriptional regulator